MIARSRVCACVLAAACSPVLAQDAERPLASYFGFEEARVVPLDPGVGPVATGDVNGDGRPDVIAANNRKSKVEILLLRDVPRPEEERAPGSPNETVKSAWYDQESVSLPCRVSAVALADVTDAPGLEIVYAGVNPPEIGVIEIAKNNKPTRAGKRSMSALLGAPEGLVVADFIGDARPEAAVISSNRVVVVPLDERGRPGEPVEIGAEAQFREVHAGDFNADGQTDLLGVAPEDRPPLRVWLHQGEGDAGRLDRELRLDTPTIRTALPVRVPGQDADWIATIESQSGRIVLQRLLVGDAATEGDDLGADETLGEVVAFRDGDQRDRSVAIVDLDGDGADELLALESGDNALAVYGVGDGDDFHRLGSFPTLSKPTRLAAGDWPSLGGPTAFALSEEERVVGVSRVTTGPMKIDFPSPMSLPSGDWTPVVVTHITVDGDPAVAVVLRDRRDYMLEVRIAGDTERSVSLKLEGVKREPAAIRSYDADNDGADDLLLLAPGEKLRMVRSIASDPTLLAEDEMSNFGLVEHAGPENSLVMDVNGDGREELVFSHTNFVRAAEYDPDTGWRVLEQTNAPLRGVNLSALVELPGEDTPRLVAGDSAGNRLIMFERAERIVVGWRTLEVVGFPVERLRSMSMGKNQPPAIVCLAEDGAAIVRPDRPGASLETVSVYTPEDADLHQHALATGDVNSDGFTDLAVLDANEQMCQLLTISQAGRLLHATEFKVFEQRLFSGGSRQYEPSQAVIADLTGDGKDDLLLVVHDRLLVHPQQTQPTTRASKD